MDHLTLVPDIFAALEKRGWMIATAESCTGGLIGWALTEIPGSSKYVDRGFITYSNEAKTEMLGVSTEMIAEHGAVSNEVARAMAAGALQHSKAQVAVAVTGIAGPDGGSEEKPVGLVYIAVATEDGSDVYEHHFGGTRGEIRISTVTAALIHLTQVLS